MGCCKPTSIVLDVIVRMLMGKFVHDFLNLLFAGLFPHRVVQDFGLTLAVSFVWQTALHLWTSAGLVL